MADQPADHSRVGQLYKLTENDEVLTGNLNLGSTIDMLVKIISENNDALLFTYKEVFESPEVYKIRLNNINQDNLFSLPRWVSLARSWDDLDRFLKEYNYFVSLGLTSQTKDTKTKRKRVSNTKTNKGKRYIVRGIKKSIVLRNFQENETTVQKESQEVYWLGYTNRESTFEPVENLKKDLGVDYYEELLSYDGKDEGLKFVIEKEYTWRWKSAWIHLITPLYFHGFTNRHIQMKQEAQKLISGLNTTSLQDSPLVDDQDAINDYNQLLDPCSAYPKKYSRGIKALLDNGYTKIKNQDGKTNAWPGIQKKEPTTGTYVNQDLNPYLLMLQGKLGQQVELANLASYLGSGVHLQASMELQRDDIGNGFIDQSVETRGRSTLEINKQYLMTIPQICRSMGKSLTNSLNLKDIVQAVEYTQSWSFGLIKNDNFVVTRADAVAYDKNKYLIYEYKSKWSPFRKPNERDYAKRVIPRDAKQCLLNAVMLAMTTSVEKPQDSIDFVCSYITPPSIGENTGYVFTHRHSIGVLSSNQNDANQDLKPIKVAVIQVLTGMQHYADTMSVCQDTTFLGTFLWKNNTTPQKLENFVGMKKICFDNERAITSPFEETYRDFVTNLQDSDKKDTSWYNMTNSNEERGIRPKRCQMGQLWRLYMGDRLLESETQTIMALWKGGAGKSKPVPETDVAQKILTEQKALAKKINTYVQSLEGKLKGWVQKAILLYPLGKLKQKSWGRQSKAGEGRCLSAIKRGYNATLIALYDPSNINYPVNRDNKLGRLSAELYEEFVLSESRYTPWLSQRFGQPESIKRVIGLVQNDFLNMTGAKEFL